MKLRLRHNSIRLRLTQGEVAKLAETGHVEEVIDFGTGAGTRLLAYAIESSAEADSVKSDFNGGKVRIIVPENIVRSWAGSDEVGISATFDPLDGSPLSLHIEKDFTCLKRRETGDEDTFPNPAAVRDFTQ